MSVGVYGKGFGNCCAKFPLKDELFELYKPETVNMTNVPGVASTFLPEKRPRLNGWCGGLVDREPGDGAWCLIRAVTTV
jgi:hypothetical protein